jgi:hypothetical protein
MMIPLSAQLSDMGDPIRDHSMGRRPGHVRGVTPSWADVLQMGHISVGPAV